MELLTSSGQFGQDIIEALGYKDSVVTGIAIQIDPNSFVRASVHLEMQVPQGDVLVKQFRRDDVVIIPKVEYLLLKDIERRYMETQVRDVP